MKTYYGNKNTGAGPQTVFVSDFDGTRVLDPLPSQKIRNHSPDGFQWGYGGSGPAQLALAILLDHFGDDQKARDYYQAFKWESVSGFFNDWRLTAEDVDKIIAKIQARDDVIMVPTTCIQCGVKGEQAGRKGMVHKTILCTQCAGLGLDPETDGV